ncbi:DUF1761 domain-containing protein [Jhaorihella thermophila]|uniref:DUF1761 domain-containing protein n=1 Tax=Jhaorihella thermophila TaxID=488547 RepID=A0A1H5VRJ7_9RHOB|nr:DUF1761 domain-containing protein [Jhaorihella thermophila]SEF89902.1 Protein of unknown function [Jhaorihella thermophila]
MEILNVLAATAAAWVLGALWYGALSGPWVRAAGVACDENGRPKGGQSPVLFVASFVLQLFVAGMMRHVFAMSGIDTVIGGLMGGVGIGLFFIAPWIALNNMYGQRPVALTAIDGGYATLACAAMGVVLALF